MRTNDTLIFRAALASLLLLAVPRGLRADTRLTEAEAKEIATVKPLPEYPPTARQLKVTGKVELEIVIGPSGSVESVRIVAGNPVLTRPCAKTVGDWKFKPVQHDGKPDRAVAPLTFEFR